MNDILKPVNPFINPQPIEEIRIDAEICKYTDFFIGYEKLTRFHNYKRELEEYIFGPSEFQIFRTIRETVNYSARTKVTSDLVACYFVSESTFTNTKQFYQNLLDLLDFQGNINLIFYLIFSIVFYRLNKAFFTINLANEIYRYSKEKKKTVKESKDV